MATSKEVFALRKAGNLDEAYRLAVKINAEPHRDDWDIRALGWCLVSLIEREYTQGNHELLSRYACQLRTIEVDQIKDGVLFYHKERALALCDPHERLCANARSLSKQGHFAEAIKIYQSLFPHLSAKSELSYGWDLYRFMQQIYKQNPECTDTIKLSLMRYLQLQQIDKPSALHSAMLALATRLAKADKLNMSVFLRMWGVDNFQIEDFSRKDKSDGEPYPALAEDALRLAVKDALKTNNKELIEYYVPLLNDFIEKFSDNLWLVYYMAKSLLSLGRLDEARNYGKFMCKRKPNDFWTWGLLAEICRNDKSAALALYAKALCCPTETAMTTVKVRIQTAQLLAELAYYEQAKYEICMCDLIKTGNNSREIGQLKLQPWYADANMPESNDDFYAEWASKADDILYSELPWIKAVVGATFIQPGRDGKPGRTRRKIYIAFHQDSATGVDSLPVEVVCNESRFPYKKLAPGSPIMIKGEYLGEEFAPAGSPKTASESNTFIGDGSSKFGKANKPFNILCFKERQSSAWDIFTSRTGVVTYRNSEKRKYHAVVDGPMEVIAPFDCLKAMLKVGDFIHVMAAKNAKGIIHAVRIEKTVNSPGEDIYKKFVNEEMEFISERFGFTKSGIFISGSMLMDHHIDHYEPVSGFAARAFDAKKSKWSWQAISINK